MPSDEGAAARSPDWTADVTERIGSAVALVRDKSTVPVVKGARAVVFGVVILAAALVLVICVVIGLVRLSIAYLPFEPRSRRVWVTYVGLGAIFLLAGLFLSRRSSTRTRE